MTETKSTRNKLFLMMVMEFFIWGAWLPLIFGYLPSLGFTPIQQAWILNAFPYRRHRRHVLSATSSRTAISPRKSSWAFSHLIGGLAILGLGFTREFLAVLRPDAGALPVLCPDHLDRQLDRLRPYEGRAEGVRLHPHGRHHRLDPRRLAVHVHSCGLGPGQGRGASWIGRLDRHGPRLRTHGPGA